VEAVSAQCFIDEAVLMSAPPVVYTGLADDGISQGYSTFSTNTGEFAFRQRGIGSSDTHHSPGHQSSGRTGAWALNDTEAQKDFGYRAFHLSYQAAKALTEAYYGKSIFKKYYAGCSTAGRMGLVEAQRYPEDFDGIVSPFSVS
jgi:hypothetical protein